MATGEQHDHHHDHHHDHQHDHHHGHDQQADDFDWEAMADHLELEATMLLPMVDDLVAHHTSVDWPSVHHLLDLGCGPGVITCALARHAPTAQVTALDRSVPLLARVRAHAAAADLARRVHAVEADMEAALPAVRPMDVVWAGMVLHHVAQPAAVLASLHRLLQPGGTLVMIEFAGPPDAVPVDDPVARSGAWDRMETAVAAGIRERVGNDPRTIEWPTLLAAAGFTDITDETHLADHAAPLEPDARRWLTAHLHRSLEWTGDQLTAIDVAALGALADQVATRDDLFVRLERRVLTARRPT